MFKMKKFAFNYRRDDSCEGGNVIVNG